MSNGASATFGSNKSLSVNTGRTRIDSSDRDGRLAHLADDRAYSSEVHQADSEISLKLQQADNDVTAVFESSRNIPMPQRINHELEDSKYDPMLDAPPLHKDFS